MTDDSPRRDDAGSRATPPAPFLTDSPGLGDVEADSTPESLNASSGVLGETRTVGSMTTNRLAFEHEGDTLVANIGSRHERSLAGGADPR